MRALLLLAALALPTQAGAADRLALSCRGTVEHPLEGNTKQAAGSAITVDLTHRTIDGFGALDITGVSDAVIEFSSEYKHGEYQKLSSGNFDRITGSFYARFSFYRHGELYFQSVWSLNCRPVTVKGRL